MALVASETDQTLVLAGGARKRKSAVLGEEEYAARLDALIERDYFPHLAPMRSMLAYMQEHDTYDLRALRSVYRSLFPSLEGATQAQEDPADADAKLSISQFFNKYISEDNDSFLELQDKSVKEHRQKYHWMYEALDNALLLDGAPDGLLPGKKQGMLMLYHIGNKVLSHAERQQVDRILGEVGERAVGDERRNGLEAWAFRVRNQLMFYPELRDSLLTCRVGAPPPVGTRAILPAATDSADPAAQRLLKDREFEAPRPRSNQKTIQRANVATDGGQLLQSFDAYLRGHAPLTLEQPHTPSTVAASPFADAATSAAGAAEFRGRRYQEVQMTPLAVPGKGVLASPLMTWGRVGAAVALDAPPSAGPLPADLADAPRFSLRPPSARERLARSLEDKLKHRATPMRPPSGPGGAPQTAPRRLEHMSPAAQGLAQRMLARPRR